ncbi:MAG: hypothetical protein ACYTE8_00405 [Planctomycetota bacterium]|jgi:hypothetical protein
MGYGIGVLGAMSPNYIEKGQGFMRNAIAAQAARSDKFKEPEEPGKSIGGGIMAAVGGASAGTSVMPGWGTLVGGVVGLAGYALS